MRRINGWNVLGLVVMLTAGHAATASADARANKVELYIEVHNMFAARMHANHDRYVPSLAGLDPENPCTAARQPGSGMYNTADSTGTIAGFRSRLRRAPRLPEDALATAMLDAAAIEIPAWNSAFDYYHRRLYTTDACAQGNVYHRQIMGAFAAFFAADDELVTFLESETRAARVAAIAQTEREFGRNFRFYHVSLVHEIELLRDALAATPLDPEAVAGAVRSMGTLAAEITPRAETSPEDVHSDLYQGQYLSFLNRVGTLVTTAQAFVDAMRSAATPAADRERRMRELDRAFTEAIEVSNHVRYSDRVR